MRLHVKGENITVETLEEVLDVIIRSRVAGNQLRVQTSFIIILIKELLRLKKDQSQAVEFDPYDDHPGLDPYPVPEVKGKENEEDYLNGLVLPENINLDEEEPQIEEKAKAKPVLKRSLVVRRKEAPNTRFWITLILVVVNVLVFGTLLFIFF